MWIDRRIIVAGVLIFAAAAAAAWACGPFFPSQLLDDRAGTLKATPTNSFAFEVSHLAMPADTLRADEKSPWARDDANPADPTPEESAGLTPEQVASVKAMRITWNGDAAYQAGAGLPEAVRLYTAGAVGYRAADPWCGPRGPLPESDYEPAPTPAPCDKDVSGQLVEVAKRFQAVLSLPAKEGAIRSVWAAYMLGQVHAALSPTVPEAAATAFALARRRAAAGDPDPSGLAVASYGEEARLYLTAAGCRWTDFYQADGCPALTPADAARVMALYAEQAARGSGIGVTSLSMIAEWTLRKPERAAAMAADPLVRRVMVAYALARIWDTVDVPPESEDAYTLGEQATGASGIPDAARDVPNVKADSRLAALLLAVEGQTGAVEGADRIAALAYRTGRYDAAARFAGYADTPMAQWVKAKLALRAGDMKAAAAAYASASRSFPTVGSGLEPASARLIKGELGVLGLAQGEYAEALHALYQAAIHTEQPANADEGAWSEPGYAEDASYIAERVLSTDELKRFVDANAPATPAPKAEPKADESYWSNPGAPLSDRFRYLLGRRMIREGRYQEALTYFPAPGDTRFTDPDARAHARQYGDAIAEADGASTDVGEAQALFIAAGLARRNGMEIMGYEQGPDYADNSGTFEGGSGRAAPYAYPPVPPPPTPEARAAQDLPGSHVTADERRRYAATEAKPFRRFHYRSIAAAHASRAADLLPPRSQAFAAVLCHAAGWIGNGEAQAADLKAVYVRYLREGAYMPWAGDFGQTCPEPNFATARWFTFWRGYLSARTWLRYHPYVPPVTLLVLAGGIGAAIVMRRRRRRGDTLPEGG